jgi:opacity protein-like surface antigen
VKKNVLNKQIKVFLSISAFLMVLPLAVFGEMGIGEQFLSVGPRATYSTPVDADSGQWFTGAQARLSLSPRVGLECSIDYRRNVFSSLTIVKSYPVQVSLMAYLFPGGGWSPFVLGGAGWYYSQVDGPVGYSHSDFRYGLHAGGGLEIMINQGMSVVGSYRFVWLDGVSSKDLNALDKAYQDSGSMITIAINLLY